MSPDYEWARRVGTNHQNSPRVAVSILVCETWLALGICILFLASDTAHTERAALDI